MTLNERLAEKKSAPLPAATQKLAFNAHEPPEETGFEVSQKLQRKVPGFHPGQHGPLDRLLETEDRADVIPMDFPTAAPEKLWQEARHAPVSQMAVVLSEDGTRAWISLVAPGQPPLLLYMLPTLGRLDLRKGVKWMPRAPAPETQQAPAGSPHTLPPIPWQPLEEEEPPCPISHGPGDNENNLPGFRENIAPSAGSDERERWVAVPVFAVEP